MALTTDATPRISPTPLQILQDEDKMKRLTASLSDGIFFYATEERATQIVEECFKICGGSPNTLSQIVQSDCFTGHSPLYWIIINHRQREAKVPPLLKKLLDVCGRLGLDAQQDIALAFSVEYNSDLYDAIKGYLSDVPRHQAFSESALFTSEGERPRLSVSAFRKQATSNPDACLEKATVEFWVPFFFKRLLTEREVYFEFPVTARLWRLSAHLKEVLDSPGGPTTHAEWGFNLSELRPSSIGSAWRMKMRILVPESGLWSITNYEGNALVVYDNTAKASPPLCVTAKPQVITVEGNSDLLTLRCNQYTSDRNGTLHGKITLSND